jgi:hypothetical protein
MAKQDTPGPFYELALDAGANSPHGLAIVLLGPVTRRRVESELHLHLADYPAARVRSCSSHEGLHLTLWSGEPLKSVRLWHSYWYLGFDVEPDCRHEDYKEGG